MALEETLACHENSVLDIASEDSSLFSVSRDGFLSIWDKEEHGFELKEKVDTLHSSALSVSLCNDSLITSGADGYIRIWSKQGLLQNSVQVTEGWVWKTLEVSPNTIVALGSDGTLVKVDISSLSTITKVCLNDSIRCAASSGNRLFAGGESGAIHELNLPTLSVLKRRIIHDGIIRDIQTDGVHIISCGEDGRIVRVNLASGDSEDIYQDSNFVTSTCWLYKQTLLSSSYSGRIDTHLL